MQGSVSHRPWATGEAHLARDLGMGPPAGRLELGWLGRRGEGGAKGGAAKGEEQRREI